MTLGAFVQACRLTARLGSWSEDWADSAIASFLAPSRLWVFAPPEAQLTLAEVLRGLAQRCPGRMRRVVSVQRCLDALNLHYWYTPPYDECEGGDGESRRKSSSGGYTARPAGGRRKSRGSHDADLKGGIDSKGWSYVSRQWVNPSTGEVLGVKASGFQLREIRARLFDAIVFMACDGDGIGRTDVAAVLGFLRGCRDNTSRCEALRLVLRLTDDPRQADRFVVASGYVAKEFYEHDGEKKYDDPCGGVDKGGVAVATFLSLLRVPDPTVRLLAFVSLAQVRRFMVQRECKGIPDSEPTLEGDKKGKEGILLDFCSFYGRVVLVGCSQ